jgi:hypothetical protein
MAKTLQLIDTSFDGENALFANFSRVVDGVSQSVHTVRFQVSSDIEAVVIAAETSLCAMDGFDPISTGDIATIKSASSAAWTPEVIAAYQAAQQGV